MTDDPLELNRMMILGFGAVVNMTTGKQNRPLKCSTPTPLIRGVGHPSLHAPNTNSTPYERSGRHQVVRVVSHILVAVMDDLSGLEGATQTPLGYSAVDVVSPTRPSATPPWVTAHDCRPCPLKRAYRRSSRVAARIPCLIIATVVHWCEWGSRSLASSSPNGSRCHKICA